MQERKTEHEQLPLEHALGRGASLMTILELMAGMGDSLASFQLTAPLQPDAQSTLNSLLLVFVLRGDAASAAKVIALGADIGASLTRDMSLSVILSQPDDKILKILLRKMSRNHDFVPYEERKPSRSKNPYNPFELVLDPHGVADSQAENKLSLDEQIDLLSKYQNIKTIVDTLIKPATNEGESRLNDLEIFLAGKPKEIASAAYRTYSLFSGSLAQDHVTKEEKFQANILRTIGL